MNDKESVENHKEGRRSIREEPACPLSSRRSDPAWCKGTHFNRLCSDHKHELDCKFGPLEETNEAADDAEEDTEDEDDEEEDAVDCSIISGKSSLSNERNWSASAFICSGVRRGWEAARSRRRGDNEEEDGEEEEESNDEDGEEKEEGRVVSFRSIYKMTTKREIEPKYDMKRRRAKGGGGGGKEKKKKKKNM